MIKDLLIALGVSAGFLGAMYVMALWMGQGRCWRCRKLTAPWSVYCRRCLDGRQA